MEPDGAAWCVHSVYYIGVPRLRALAVPHAAASDGEYRGYFIPAKTFVVANVWAILHDETVYPDAEKFIPERYLNDDVPNSLDVAFGFGRRYAFNCNSSSDHVINFLFVVEYARANTSRNNIFSSPWRASWPHSTSRRQRMSSVIP